MFSEDHYKILQALLPEGSSPQAIADKVGLSVALTSHLLEELNSYEFVEIFREPDGFADLEIVCANLKPKGKAAIESPDYFIGKPMNPQNNNWTGDRIAGDKIGGDKVMGNKVQIGTVQGDAIAGNKTVNPNTAELLQLITSLRQTAATFPKEIQEELTIDLDDVELELKKPEADRNPTKLKKRLLALATAGTLIATPIAGITNFANTAIDLATKVGIELPLK